MTKENACGLYSSAAYTPVRLILQCGLYSSVAYTPVWLILQCGLYSSVAYRIISNISTVLYFFNVPPPRAINGDVPLLETSVIISTSFQRHVAMPNSCQTHTFQGFFAGTDNEFTQCAYNGD